MHLIGENPDDFQQVRRKKALYKTKAVDKKTQNPFWDYKGSHLIDIDEEMVMKLQSESITVAVYGMQDGREKFAMLKGVSLGGKDPQQLNNNADDGVDDDGEGGMRKTKTKKFNFA